MNMSVRANQLGSTANLRRISDTLTLRSRRVTRARGRAAVPVPLAAFVEGQPITGQTVVVTGANRGIGLEFTRQLLAKNNKVVAACRCTAPLAKVFVKC